MMMQSNRVIVFLLAIATSITVVHAEGFFTVKVPPETAEHLYTVNVKCATDGQRMGAECTPKAQSCRFYRRRYQCKENNYDIDVNKRDKRNGKIQTVY